MEWMTLVSKVVSLLIVAWSGYELTRFYNLVKDDKLNVQPSGTKFMMYFMLAVIIMTINQTLLLLSDNFYVHPIMKLSNVTVLLALHHLNNRVKEMVDEQE